LAHNDYSCAGRWRSATEPFLIFWAVRKLSEKFLLGRKTSSKSIKFKDEELTFLENFGSKIKCLLTKKLAVSVRKLLFLANLAYCLTLDPAGPGNAYMNCCFFTLSRFRIMSS